MNMRVLCCFRVVDGFHHALRRALKDVMYVMCERDGKKFILISTFLGMKCLILFQKNKKFISSTLSDVDFYEK